MARRTRRPIAPALRSDLTPLIDVTFLILIFFLLTIRFRTLEGKLDARLPKGDGVNPTSAPVVDRARLVIEVERAGTRLAPESDAPWSGAGPFRYGPDRALRYTCGPRAVRDLAGVRAWLESMRAHDPAIELVIDARADTVHADVVAVLDLAGLVGFQGVALAGARP
jgi:biopolymer transport protein ExbD